MLYFAYAALQVIYHFIGKGDKKVVQGVDANSLKEVLLLNAVEMCSTWLSIHLS